MANSLRAGERVAFPAVADFLDLKRGSGDDDGTPLRRALWLAEDLAALGSKENGFDFQGFADLVARARDVLRLAKGRRSLLEQPDPGETPTDGDTEGDVAEQGRDWLTGKMILEEGGAR